MPLPNLKTRCSALCRARGYQCLNPAAFGMPVCRYHGARRTQAIKRGEEHGRYKSGEFTQATKLAYREGIARIVELETLAFRVGMTKTRRAGRKPEVG